MVNRLGSAGVAGALCRVATAVGAVGLSSACSLDDRSLQEGHTTVDYDVGDGGGGGQSGSTAAGAGSDRQHGVAGSSGDSAEASGGGGAGGDGGDGSDDPLQAGAEGIPLGGQGGIESTGGLGHVGAAGAQGYPHPCSSAEEPTGDECTVSRVSNATLDEGWVGWYTEPGVAMDWSRADCHGNEASGSLAVRNRSTGTSAVLTRAAAHQCISMDGAGEVSLAAMVLIPGDQSVAARAALGLSFYSAPDCSSIPVHEFVAADVMLSDFWLPMECSTMAPSSTRSVSVRLVATKRFLDDEIEILFDDVLVQTD